MEGQNKNIALIVGGIVVAVVVAYFAFGGGKLPGATPKIEGEKTEQGVVVAPNSSPISEEGVVLTETGTPAKLDVAPGSPEAPKQSSSITEGEIPKAAIKLEADNYFFSPNEFTVKAGSLVTLSLTAKGSATYIFKFKDPSLSAVAVGVGSGQTRVIPFNAPEKKGEYIFYSDVPGHEARGLVGKMIVE
jgi:plastocyanin